MSCGQLIAGDFHDLGKQFFLLSLLGQTLSDIDQTFEPALLSMQLLFVLLPLASLTPSDLIGLVELAVVLLLIHSPPDKLGLLEGQGTERQNNGQLS